MKFCSTKGTKTYKSGNVASHTYNTTGATKATLTKNAKKNYKCSLCGTTKSSVICYPKTIKLSKISYAYDGKEKKPSIIVTTSNGKTLKNGTDYTVAFSSVRKECQTYIVIVAFKGNYSGTKKLTFKIALPKVSGLKQLNKMGINSQWNAVCGASGYQVYC